MNLRQPTDSELRRALDEFDALLQLPKTRENVWQSLFERCPYILSRSLPLRVEPRQIIALARPGRKATDFAIHPDPESPGSARGLIEIKTPQSCVLTFPRKDIVTLSRGAATAVAQVIDRSMTYSWPDRVVVLGGAVHKFVIMGLTKVWSERLVQDIELRTKASGLLQAVNLLGYDDLFRNYEASVPRRLVLLVPHGQQIAAAATDGELIGFEVHQLELLIGALTDNLHDPHWSGRVTRNGDFDGDEWRYESMLRTDLLESAYKRTERRGLFARDLIQVLELGVGDLDGASQIAERTRELASSASIRWGSHEARKEVSKLISLVRSRTT